MNEEEIVEVIIKIYYVLKIEIYGTIRLQFDL